MTYIASIMNKIISSCDNVNRLQQLQSVQSEAKELFRRKNADYGDAFATYGTIGILATFQPISNALATK